MATTKRKFGKRNVIKVDPVAYNVGLIGESGIGKTTIMKEVAEKLTGYDGYLILNMGREDGVDALADVAYEDIPDFETLEEFTDDVVENREAYKDLKLVIIDTLDELFRITEPEVIRLHNKEFPDKKVKTIKAAFGGFQAGEDKVIELIIDQLWKLKDVGVNFWVVGHTKRKSVNDVATGEEYETLTSNMMAKYFNAIKTKLHFLGIASVDRTIEKQRIKQKIGGDKIVGKVTNENRIITFRDDNFNIDSKSRFTEIVPEIELDADQFIQALTDAIEKEHGKQKGAKSIEETKVEQEKEKEIEVEKTVEKMVNSKVDADENEELLLKIQTNFPKATKEIKANIVKIMGEYGIKSFKDSEEIPTIALRKIAAELA